MQRIQNPTSQQEGIAFEDVSELFAASNALQGKGKELFTEVHGALGEAIELGSKFNQVRIFGEDAALTLTALNELAHQRISRRQASRDNVAVYWKSAARQMLGEYTNPGLRARTNATVAAHDENLARAGHSPYYQRLIGWQTEQRIKQKPNLDFGKVFSQLAELELDPKAAEAGPTSFDGLEGHPSGVSARHSDRVLVLVK